MIGKLSVHTMGAFGVLALVALVPLSAPSSPDAVAPDSVRLLSVEPAPPAPIVLAQGRCYNGRCY